MRVCVLHAAGDLGLEERPALPLGPDQVRVRLGAGASAAPISTITSRAGSATSRCASP